MTTITGNAPCGTRSRYVRGCRCSNCRAANVRAYHDRQARAKAAALAIAPAPTVTTARTWTAPDGSTQVRTFRRGCPGTTGGCPFASVLRKDSIGGLCARCRSALVWNGLVPAARARAHLRKLSHLGVGRRAVAAASSVSASSLQRIRTGRKTQIRAETERRILAVDRHCTSDRALVDARPAWKRLRRLMADGYPAARLVRLLGMRGSGLQFGARWMTARNVQRVERLYRELLALS